jgi:hypothetical protein
VFRIKRQASFCFSEGYLNKVGYFAKSISFVNHEQSSVITTLTSRYIRRHASFKTTKEMGLQF